MSDALPPSTNLKNLTIVTAANRLTTATFDIVKMFSHSAKIRKSRSGCRDRMTKITRVATNGSWEEFDEKETDSAMKSIHVNMSGVYYLYFELSVSRMHL